MRTRHEFHVKQRQPFQQASACCRRVFPELHIATAATHSYTLAIELYPNHSHPNSTSPSKTNMSDQSPYVTLISSDGYSFIVQRSSACISGAIKRMLDPSCTSSRVYIDIDAGRHQPQ
jgi:hypothetical protein